MLELSLMVVLSAGSVRKIYIMQLFICTVICNILYTVIPLLYQRETEEGFRQTKTCFALSTESCVLKT